MEESEYKSSGNAGLTILASRKPLGVKMTKIPQIAYSMQIKIKNCKTPKNTCSVICSYLLLLSVLSVFSTFGVILELPFPGAIPPPLSMDRKCRSTRQFWEFELPTHIHSYVFALFCFPELAGVYKEHILHL